LFVTTCCMCFTFRQHQMSH